MTLEDDLESKDIATQMPKGKTSTLELSVVMPCLNEADSLEICIKKAQRALREHKIVGEIIVADNGSTDGSQTIADNLGARVVNIEDKGYGNALMGGFAAARGKFIIMGDADDSYDFTALKCFVTKLREGYDLVMGNRFKGGIKPGAMPPLHKYLGNPVLTWIGQLFFHSSCGDFHCGLRGFNKAAIMKLDLRTTGMEFASEMVVKATLYKMRITEVPTTLSPDARNRPPHLRSWRDGWRHLRFLLLYSPRWLFLYPGALLMLLGLITGLWLFPCERNIRGVTFDVNTLLFASLAILCGYQSMLFAFFTKIFAISERLIPEDRRMTRFFEFVNLEKGLIAASLVMVIGVTLLLSGVNQWRLVGFGDLDYTQTMRLVIPGTTLTVLGFQTVLSSFFLSVLGMHRR
jgi:glycosyltransferase involved in cell wall biosynthesis